MTVSADLFADETLFWEEPGQGIYKDSAFTWVIDPQ
jgi:fructose-1,6-bisphosphatase/inositol monophosphatase family enzyme